jgi:hypothetical protein
MGRGPYAGKKAGAVQTNDDAKEEECQTDEVHAEAAGSSNIKAGDRRPLIHDTSLSQYSFRS